MREGDVVVGLPSNGVHANGFTLVRQVLEDEDYDGPDLLAPTRLYLDDVRRLRSRAHAFAHVTGGGIEGNLGRVVPDGLRAELDWDAWERLPVFDWLARHVDEDELRRVFNLGIGYCAVVPEAEPGELVIGRIVVGVIGVLVSGEGTNLQALLDAELPISAVASNRAAVRALERAERRRRAARGLRARRVSLPEERDRAMALWLCEQGAEVARARRLHAPADAAVPRALPRADRQRASVAPAASPGARAIEDCAGGGRSIDRCNRPLRRRGHRQRVGDRPGARRRRAGAIRSRCAGASRQVEHWLLPRCVV